MTIQVFSAEEQFWGEIDGGKLVEQKPIGFPNERTSVDRIGTLFYWAWFRAKEDAFLPLHPHRGFEIISYLLNGKVFHQDTLGNEKNLKSGGLQIMQTGSGVQHSEKYYEGTSGFQIWFEPYIGESNNKTPNYADYKKHELPFEVKDGYSITTILGENSPAHLVADTNMWDITVTAGHSYEHNVPKGYSIAGLIVEGQSNWHFDNQSKTVNSHMFVVCEAMVPSTLKIETDINLDTRFILIQVPSVLPYPSYKEIKDTNVVK